MDASPKLTKTKVVNVSIEKRVDQNRVNAEGCVEHHRDHEGVDDVDQDERDRIIASDVVESIPRDKNSNESGG